MYWIRFIILILAGTIIQNNLISLIAVTKADIQPDLLLVLMTFFALFSRTEDAIISSFFIGFIADLTGLSVGPQMIGFGITGSVIAEMRHLLALKRIPHQMALTFTAGLVSSGIAMVLYPIKGYPSSEPLQTALLWQPLYSAVLCPFIFFPTALIMKMSHNMVNNKW